MVVEDLALQRAGVDVVFLGQQAAVQVIRHRLTVVGHPVPVFGDVAVAVAPAGADRRACRRFHACQVVLRVVHVQLLALCDTEAPVVGARQRVVPGLPCSSNWLRST